MAKGRKTGGRKKGIPNRATSAKAAEIESSGLTPLDFMLAVLRDTENDKAMRLAAAKDAAPYVHPKLANIELSGKDGGPLNVSVTRYSDPAQPVDAASQADAGVARAGTGNAPRSPVLAPTIR